MSQIAFNQENLKKKSQVHILPCKIMYDGEAKVNSFFTNSIISHDSSVKKEEVESGRFFKINSYLKH
jgi:hypothetical protein